VGSGLLPRLPVDSRLPQDACEQFSADVALVWVRDAKGDLAANHELVLSARLRPFEAEPSEGPDQLGESDRPERGHPY
jgi:hypothetical protein